MNLDDKQKKLVATWIEQGLKLSEIQKRLADELEVHLTYMETRFLMDDLKLQPKDIEPPKELPSPLAPSTPSAAPGARPDTQAPGSPGGLGAGEGAGAPGDVTVSVDQVMRPGAIVSGKVTFSDGKNAGWYLDQTGRLGIVPDEPGYKPSQGDLMIFEGELQNALGKMGF